MRAGRKVLSRIFVDTLFVIALINPRDQHHAIAAKLAAKHENHPLLVTEAVLLEIGNGLARNYKQEAIAVIESFLASEEVEIVHVTPELFQRGFDLYKKYQDKAWGLIDCISFVVMADFGIRQALTFDQHFDQAGFEPLMTGNNI
jgi:predicted nucleic acid-binding protein